jgi:methionine sulfoxide reductase heme-binding subunit
MSGPRLLIAMTLVISMMPAAIVLVTGEPVVLIRWTGRTSFILFALVYVARPATQLWPGHFTKRLLAQRKWLGNAFAISHVAHLLGIVLLAAADWGSFAARITIATSIPILAFVVLFAMSITSIDSVRRAMPRPAWTALHGYGMHLLYVVFVSTYAVRMISPFGLLAMMTIAAITGVRGAAWLRGRAGVRSRRPRVSVGAWHPSTRSW